MKLIRLKIADSFRSLKNDFELNFREPVINESLLDFHPFCFAGLNGSGKSNVLEALSNIFYHLECIVNDYPVFAYDPKESNPDSFELEYFITSESLNSDLESLNHISIKKEKGQAPLMSINGNGFLTISKSFGSSFIPDLIVAYSSGENETLSLPYIKMKLFQYDQYLEDLRDRVEFKKPKSSLLYIDYEMSQAVLLTILMFFDFEKDGKSGVLSTLEEEIKISGIQQFTININNHWQKIVPRAEENNLIEVETILKIENDEDTENRKVYLGRVLDNLDSLINKLKECATCSYTKDNYLSLDFFVDKNTISLIRKKFENDPYTFFSLFQTLHSLNERVEENVYKEEVYNSKGYYTDYKRPEYVQFFYFTNYHIKQLDEKKTRNLLLRQLSDGEQQFLHTLGICLMLQNKRTLLLLDEPETHFNPEWRSKFINILRKTLHAGNDNFLLKDIILTSHSPFIISDCFPDKVIVFEKGKQPQNAQEKDIDTFGTSVNILTNKIFKRKNTIGEYSLEKLNNYRKRFLETDDLEGLIDELNLELGDSIEKVLLIKEMTDLINKR
ncbi:restriction system-associated AAA family ATPase [Chryseobacterium sp. KLBC 52]|uniref:restriction system-associated AAA family ATPase n=1 Tax=Chryseobacterium sp. KLBC 52 TaxID=1862702 RepID=UPI000E0A95A9|nr:restriction system-associated AAA family ATPase [Chryseobacterium sp. KLBC 52]